MISHSSLHTVGLKIEAFEEIISFELPVSSSAVQEQVFDLIILARMRC